MKIRLLFVVLLLLQFSAFAIEPIAYNGLFAQELNRANSANSSAIKIISIDELSSLEAIKKHPNVNPDTVFYPLITPTSDDNLDITNRISSWNKQKYSKAPERLIRLDPVFYAANPLFKELIFTGIPVDLEWNKWEEGSYLFYGKKARTLNNAYDVLPFEHPEKTLRELRQEALNYITHNAPHLYIATIDQLPTFNLKKDEVIETRPVERLDFETGQVPLTSLDRKIIRKKEKGPWDYRLQGLVQLSHVGVSKNWHKGGYNNMAVSAIITGKVNYDNGKKVKWENSLEWRTGVNSLPPDTSGKRLKNYLVNDDIFRINSKYGLKATGKFYYSSSMELETQFLENYNDDSFSALKAKSISPLRFNFNVGIDYKPTDFLSVAVSPFSFKYIYLNDTISSKGGIMLDPNQFGIEKGENQLKQIGSRIVVELKSYRPIPALKLDSKLNFYTNYETVEIDWEIVAELAFNRFFSTRLMLNPRYDNTMIMENDEKAKIQIREMLTVGFSYRFL